MSYDYLFKVVLIGDSPTGKSCLLLQFLENRFRPQHDLTIGVEFGSRNLVVNSKTVKLQVWDTAGQETFRSITRSYYRGSVAALLLFDVTNRATFDHLEMWLSETRVSPTMMVILVGNRVDLEGERQVSQSEAQDYAEAHGLLYIEASAKTGHNVENCFRILVEKVLTNIEAQVYDLSSDHTGIKVGSSKPAN